MGGGMSEKPDMSSQWPLSEDWIDRLLSDAQTQSATHAHKTITRDLLLSVGYTVDELLDALGKIAEFPSQYTIDAYKQQMDDAYVVAALNDPYVTLGLYLRKAYQMDELPFFNALVQFDSTKSFDVKPDRIMEKFKEEARYFLPPLPEIRDEALAEQVLSGKEHSEELYGVGRSSFVSEANEFLYIRFMEQEIMSDINIYIQSRHVAATWARLYHLVESDEDIGQFGTAADEHFFMYIGALVLSTAILEDGNVLRVFIATLIEPIARQFDEYAAVNETSKEELAQLIPGARYDLVYTSTHENDSERLYIVLLYGKIGSLILGIGVDHSIGNAERRAAVLAMYKKTHLDRMAQCTQELTIEEGHLCLDLSHPAPVITDLEYLNDYYPHIQPHSCIVPGPHPVAPPPAYNIPIITPSVYYNGPPVAVAPPPHNRVSSTPPPHCMTPSSLAMVPVINQDYQRQKLEDTESIPLAPHVHDDAEWDKSSKQRLNDLLMELSYSSADYKTSKLNNVDVQVICIIENIPIARAIASNKKRAGHVAAQYILSNYEYFLSQLTPR